MKDRLKHISGYKKTNGTVVNKYVKTKPIKKIKKGGLGSFFSKILK